MQGNIFFNEEQRTLHVRYFSTDFKRKRVKELENNLVSISDICKTHHVSRTSVYRWLYKYSNTEVTTLSALRMVIKSRGSLALEGAIFHSDGGGQYYSNEFKKLTKALKMSNSMTEETVYENSHAERLNGTIKNSYLYSYGPETFKELEKELKRAVYMYNNGKPHHALNKMTPVQYRNTHSVDFENNSSQVQSYSRSQQNSIISIMI